VRIVCFSDTHAAEEWVKLPDGDVVIFCGDFSGMGTLADVNRFAAYLRFQPHKYKIMIYGNHDLACQNMNMRPFFPGINVLFDSSIDIEGLQIYGTPWQPIFMKWAFMREDEDLERLYAHIPAGLDILVTHCPPRGILDRNIRDQHCGSLPLLHRVSQVKPKVHIFGHIHESGGTGYTHMWENKSTTMFVNCSLTNHMNLVCRIPFVFDI
jgi:predicted phosphohydrolase